MKLIVPSQPSPMRLDRFLVLQIPHTSRAFWNEHASEVRVDGKRAIKGLRLYGGETVFVEDSLATTGPVGLPPDPGVVFSVVHEAEDFLVVEKPPHVPVHPLKKNETGSLMQGVAARYPETARAGVDSREGGLVHRLDNETSGLLLVARNRAAYDFLREEFRRHRVEKEYAAWVLGKVVGAGNGWQEIATPVGHHPKNKKKMILDPEGRPAVTRYRTVLPPPQEKPVPDGATFLRVRILTGVRHQIRVHLASIGHPVLGDSLYGPPQMSSHGRLFLHATRLKFRDPRTLEFVEYESAPTF